MKRKPQAMRLPRESLTQTLALVVLLVWIYYSAQIFLFGAEFTHAFANRYGSRSESGNIDLKSRS